MKRAVGSEKSDVSRCPVGAAWRSRGLSSVEWYPTNPESCDVEALFCSSIGAWLPLVASCRVNVTRLSLYVSALRLYVSLVGLYVSLFLVNAGETLA